jgi:hypothetical protein
MVTKNDESGRLSGVALGVATGAFYTKVITFVEALNIQKKRPE